MYANRFPPSKHVRYRSSWGPSSVSVFNHADVPRPASEEDYLDYYPERLHSAQSRQLLPLQEDLADWVNETTNVEHVTVDNFFDVLDNGALLCRLARVIQEKARSAIDAGRAKGPVPVIRGRCWENAARRSFFSRDNMENFIQFCRRLGVHENLLFESDDLVLQGQPRNVVLCLMEVARLASRYSLEPPALVQLEREIDAEQERDLHCLSDSGISHSSLVSWQFQPPSPPASPRPSVDKMKHSRTVRPRTEQRIASLKKMRRWVTRRFLGAVAKLSTWSGRRRRRRPFRDGDVDDGLPLVGPTDYARSGNAQICERQRADRKRRSAERHDGRRLVPRQCGGPGRGPVAFKFPVTVIGGTTGTHGTNHRTRSEGEKSHGSRTEALSVSFEQMQQTQGAESRRGPVSHRWTERFHKAPEGTAHDGKSRRRVGHPGALPDEARPVSEMQGHDVHRNTKAKNHPTDLVGALRITTRV